MFLLTLFACKSPDVAPATLDEMSSGLLVGFESDDLAALTQPLADWLVDHVDDSDGYSLALLTADQVGDMQPQPQETDVSRHRGIGVTHRVAGSLEQHVAIVPEADQSFADPTYAEWSRTIVEGSAEGFVAGEDLRTDNFISKSGAFGVSIDYPMLKDYRWVTLTQGDTAVFRSWSTESGCSESGTNCLFSGFTIELWVPDAAGLIWYNASWNELVTDADALVGEDYIRQEFIDGTLDYMDGTADHATGADQ